jgi:hypothetical protein
MNPVLCMIEKYLTKTSAQPFSEYDRLKSDLTIDGVPYRCEFWEDEGVLAFTAEWCERVAKDRLLVARRIFQRLVRAGDGVGQKVLYKFDGHILLGFIVDVAMMHITPKKIGLVVEKLIKDFGEKLKLLKRVLAGQLSIDDAIKMVKELTKDSPAKQIGEINRLLRSMPLSRLYPKFFYFPVWTSGTKVFLIPMQHMIT